MTVFALFVVDMKGTAKCPPGWKKNWVVNNDVLEKGFKKANVVGPVDVKYTGHKVGKYT